MGPDRPTCQGAPLAKVDDVLARARQESGRLAGRKELAVGFHAATVSLFTKNATTMQAPTDADATLRGGALVKPGGDQPARPTRVTVPGRARRRASWMSGEPGAISASRFPGTRTTAIGVAPTIYWSGRFRSAVSSTS